MEDRKTTKTSSPEVNETGGAHGAGASARACVARGGDLLELGTPGERDDGLWEGMTSEVRERLKALDRENRELRQVNEILRKASV